MLIVENHGLCISGSYHVSKVSGLGVNGNITTKI